MLALDPGSSNAGDKLLLLPLLVSKWSFLYLMHVARMAIEFYQCRQCATHAHDALTGSGMQRLDRLVATIFSNGCAKLQAMRALTGPRSRAGCGVLLRNNNAS